MSTLRDTGAAAALCALAVACGGGTGPAAGVPAVSPAPGDGAASMSVASDPVAPALRFVPAAVTPTSALVDVVYARPAERPGPRVMELVVRVSSELRLDGHDPLAAATAADKELFVQARGETLRVLLLSPRSTARLEPGPLVRLAFARSAPGPGRIEAVAGGPVFAPAEADEGLALPTPLTLEAP